MAETTAKGSHPKLNLDSPAVVSELKSVLEFWIEKGVDGFNLVGYEDLRPVMGDPTGLTPTYTNLVKQLRSVVDRAAEEQGQNCLTLPKL